MGTFPWRTPSFTLTLCQACGCRGVPGPQNSQQGAHRLRPAGVSPPAPAAHPFQGGRPLRPGRWTARGRARAARGRARAGLQQTRPLHGRDPWVTLTYRKGWFSAGRGEKEVRLEEGEPIPFPLPFREGRQGKQGPLHLPGGNGGAPVLKAEPVRCVCS